MELKLRYEPVCPSVGWYLSVTIFHRATFISMHQSGHLFNYLPVVVREGDETCFADTDSVQGTVALEILIVYASHIMLFMTNLQYPLEVKNSKIRSTNLLFWILTLSAL